MTKLLKALFGIVLNFLGGKVYDDLKKPKLGKDVETPDDIRDKFLERMRKYEGSLHKPK